MYLVLVSLWGVRLFTLGFPTVKGLGAWGLCKGRLKSLIWLTFVLMQALVQPGYPQDRNLRHSTLEIDLFLIQLFLEEVGTGHI